MSQLCVHTFTQYSRSQIRRMQNKSANASDQEQKEKHILQSIEAVNQWEKEKYSPYDDNSINLYYRYQYFLIFPELEEALQWQT